MKTEYKTTSCSVWVHASDSENKNIMCIHRYDDNDEPLDVIRIVYESTNMPPCECMAALEQAAEKEGYEIDLRESDGCWYHGYVTE